MKKIDAYIRKVISSDSGRSGRETAAILSTDKRFSFFVNKAKLMRKIDLIQERDLLSKKIELKKRLERMQKV